MWTYPWDVIDEGVDRVMGIFKDEMGIDAMSISTAYHTYDALRTHLPGKKIYSCDEDSIYFKPQIELYNDTAMKPNVHPITKDRNILRTISEACDAKGLDLISWTVAMHNHYLARQYANCALIAGLSASHMESAELMQDIISAAYEGGARRFSYYVYCMTPRRNFKWIGDAVSAVRDLDAENG